ICGDYDRMFGRIELAARTLDVSAQRTLTANQQVRAIVAEILDEAANPVSPEARVSMPYIRLVRDVAGGNMLASTHVEYLTQGCYPCCLLACLLACLLYPCV